jgi:hypothetical protein
MQAFKAVVLLFAFAAAVAFAQPSAKADAPPPAREPQSWLLLLSGFLVAGWVAHRRLVNNF